MSAMPDPESEPLPRRDFLILPILSVLTVVVMWGAAEVVARHAFRESGIESCGMPGTVPGRMKPNCVSWRKGAEGPEVTMSYNDCGFRTREPCGSRPEGTLRIALLGASTTAGYKVRFEDTSGQRVSEALTRACGRPVEVQNMGIAGYELLDSYLRVDEALALKPDVVMFLFGTYDIEAISDPARMASRDNPDFRRPNPGEGPARGERPRPIMKRLVDMTVESRAIVMVQHFLYSDRDTYLKLFMLYDDKADYVRVPLSTMWEKRLAAADMLLGDMARKVHAAGVPFVAVLAPSQLQVALLSAPNRPAAVDAFAMDDRLASIAARNGIVFVDTLGEFRSVNVPAQVFYPVDGHLNGDGHARLANAIVRRLIDGSVSAFAQCKPAASTARG